jgi:long-chain acyl-CoA synthetase
MEYLSTDKDENGMPAPRGEICVRGPPVIKDYFMKEDKTKEAIDEDGWLHTGDIGILLPTGAFRVIDRKKNIFKLQQGEYVAPEKVENIYVKFPYFGEAYVHGEPLQNHCIGFFTMDE